VDRFEPSLSLEASSITEGSENPAVQSPKRVKSEAHLVQKRPVGLGHRSNNLKRDFVHLLNTEFRFPGKLQNVVGSPFPKGDWEQKVLKIFLTQLETQLKTNRLTPVVYKKVVRNQAALFTSLKEVLVAIEAELS
jgi:hypothetical protein